MRDQSPLTEFEDGLLARRPIYSSIPFPSDYRPVEEPI